jgi:hypothetical protein
MARSAMNKATIESPVNHRKEFLFDLHRFRGFKTVLCHRKRSKFILLTRAMISFPSQDRGLCEMSSSFWVIETHEVIVADQDDKTISHHFFRSQGIMALSPSGHSDETTAPKFLTLYSLSYKPFAHHSFSCDRTSFVKLALRSAPLQSKHLH